jgi:glycosyltransferase involved in cell wall biosynthesis/rhamnogalacturonyl hydrolase YesR
MTDSRYVRKTILMVAYTYYESDPRVIREAQAAVEGGFEVDFIALRRPGTPRTERIRGVRVIRLNQVKYRGGGYFKYLLAYLQFFLRCLVKTTTLFFKRRYRAIHVNNMPDFLVFTTIIPKIFGTKVILDIHDPMPNTFASKFKGQENGFFYQILLWEERLSAAYCNQVITVHHPLKDGILLKHGFRPNSIEVIANFADSELFPLLKSFSVEGKIRFVFHGTILERSGLRLLILAVAGMRHKDRISVKIIGEGDFSQTLKEMIESLNLGQIVEFDNQCYPAHSISERIDDCSAGLVPLEISSVTNYALPLKLLEYMSLGLPVVTVRSQAISYYFGEDDCIFFDSNNARSLGDALDRIAENPEILLRYRERSVALRESFSWAGEKAKYVALLRKLTGGIESMSVFPKVRDTVEGSIGEVTRWVEEHNYQAYDPGDGDLSFLRYLTFDVHLCRRILTAIVLRTPFHIRPWIGIPPHTSTKGMGYFGWGYLKMYSMTRDESYRRRAEACFDWLIENCSPGNDRYCWGNHFSFSTRAGTIPKYTPTIVWTSLIGLAFLEGYEVLGNERYLEVAASTAEWTKTLPREKTSRGTCLSYVPFAQSSIHNSNMLGGALLARVAAYTGDQEASEIAREAMAYSCARQNGDGAWFYGEAEKYHWIDNFHTGYNLDCLKRYIDSTGNREFESNLWIGFNYFTAHFFERDGRPKYYHNRVLPTDIQCAAQAIDTLAFFSETQDDAQPLAEKVACWTIEHMQARDGHFYYRDLGWKKIKAPMLHWGQGTMFKALAHLLSKQKARFGKGGPVPRQSALSPK